MMIRCNSVLNSYETMGIALIYKESDSDADFIQFIFCEELAPSKIAI